MAVLQVVRHSNAHSIGLRASSFPSGGEGVIYEVEGTPGLLAKIYKQSDPERAHKLFAMVANPPDVTQAGGHCPLAWPVDLLRSPGHPGEVVGFLMPRASNMRQLIDFYTPKTRRSSCPPGFNYKYLHRTARNLAAVFHSLHTKNYVVGDVKESNILASSAALITLVDTDSFQVRSKGRVFRCPVKTPEYTPPELQHCNPRDGDRTPLHDLFGLAVLSFQLLMEGSHPFSGVYSGAGDPPPVSEHIANGAFAFCSAKRLPACSYHLSPPPLAPPFEILHPKLQSLFERCFVLGHHDSSARPSALMWHQTLLEAENDL